MSQLVSEIFSWSWFISVFVAGILINLVSAYIKPALDRHLAQRFERIRQKNRAIQTDLEERSSLIASDSTLLIVEGQRLTSTENNTMTAFVMFLVVLTFGIFAQASDISLGKKAYLELAVYVSLGIIMVLTLHFMNQETKQSTLVHAARKKHASKI